jgi:hypothetical protein
MVRRDSKKLHFSMGLLIMAAQFAGAFGGALLMAFFSWAT